MKRLNLNSLLFVFGLAITMFLGACNSDPCKDDPCGPNGDCIAVGDDYDCVCDAGYEGVNCETLSRDKFLSATGGTSTWDATDVCTSSAGTNTYPYDATISIASAGDDRVLVNNFAGLGTTINIPGSVNGNTITLANGTYAGGQLSNATATISNSNNAISVTYTFTTGSGVTESCTGTWTRL